ncbi:MAG: large repetitive protein, partial [Solirubrobacteraceae bacterium]|nr:large repetitive protein [Solirubrobacteraceae bacterium]
TEITSGPDGPTNDPTPSFGFQASPGGPSGFRCGIDVAVPNRSCDGPTYTTEALDDGPHFFVVSAERAGELDATPARRDFIVDTRPPDLQIKLGPPDPTQPGVYPGPVGAQVVASDPNGLAYVHCKVDPPPGGTLPTCGLVGGPVTVSASGPHRIVAEAADAAGNIAAADVSFLISNPPEATITSPAHGVTNDTTPAFAFTSDQNPATFACRVDLLPFGPCDSGDAVAALADGAHVFEVRATNADGVTGPAASETLTVDTAAPQTAIALGPPDPVSPGVYVSTVLATVSATDNAGVGATRCVLDPGTAPTVFADLPNAPCPYAGGATVTGRGAHVIYAASRDTAGNPEAPLVSRSFTIRATPSTTITAGPSGATNDATPAFTFESDAQNATFDCAVDGAAPVRCASGDALAALTDGEHTFEVHATADGARDPAGAKRNLRVDTKPPVTTITFDPASGVDTNAVRVHVAADDPTPSSGVDELRCVVDPATVPASFADLPATACPWPAFQDGPDFRAPGHYVIYAAARDLAGNAESPVVKRSFRVIPTPKTRITAGPEGPTATASPAFAFTSDQPEGATYACTLDGAAVPACASPQSVGPLGDGAHTFFVRSTNADGDADPGGASRSFVVDTTAPVTTIGLPLAALISGTTTFTDSAHITVSAEDAGSGVAETRCALDAPASTFDALPAAACPYLGPGADIMTVGGHVVYAASRDKVANTETPVVQQAFTIRTPVDTRIIDKPAATTYIRSARLTFDATVANSTFDCRIDGGAWIPGCRTPFDTGSLADGRHTFDVRATTADGAVDLTPATWTWTIPAPQTNVSACQVQMRWQPETSFEDTCAMTPPARCPAGALCQYALTMDIQDGDRGEVTYDGLVNDWPHSWTYRYQAGYPAIDDLGPRCQTYRLSPEYRNDHRGFCEYRFQEIGGAPAPAGYYRGADCAHHPDEDGHRPDLSHVNFVACDRFTYSGICTGSTHWNFTASYMGSTPSVRGRDGSRFIRCELRVKTSAPGQLATTAAANNLTVNAPGPGILAVRLAGARAAGLRAVAAAATLLRPSQQTVAAAGPVALKLGLTRTAKLRLRRRGSLKLRLALTFTPASGDLVTRTTEVRLTRIVKARIPHLKHPPARHRLAGQ